VLGAVTGRSPQAAHLESFDRGGTNVVIDHAARTVRGLAADVDV